MDAPERQWCGVCGTDTVPPALFPALPSFSMRSRYYLSYTPYGSYDTDKDGKIGVEIRSVIETVENVTADN